MLHAKEAAWTSSKERFATSDENARDLRSNEEDELAMIKGLRTGKITIDNDESDDITA